ncbi:MAG: ribosomal protein L13e [Candidatus Bathyarchaeota archaeon]|jgi:large subunit ribosomal protein L13e|nr:ribosomal protein L13e [Candidatus Bathyarchaeota archaeon]
MVRMISPVVKRGTRVKTGKGFSIGELSDAGLNVGEARHLGVPVDQRRSTSYPENVESLKAWVEEANREGFRVPKTKQSSKGQRGRAFRGLTSSGKKMRGHRKP